MKKGFTLIEILVVFGILGIIIVFGSNMFFTILKGSTKTRVLTEVKQNGNYALEVMERMIRNARNLEAYSGNSIVIVGLDGGKTNFVCSQGKIASNGASLMSDKVVVKNCTNIFSVNPGELGTQPDVVMIDFILSQAEGAKAEEKAEANFKTMITLRNY